MKVKICGLQKWDDVKVAIDAGADMVGFVFEPTSPRFVTEELDFIKRVPDSVITVAVFGELPTELPAEAKNCSAIQWVSGILPAGSPKHRIKSLRMGGDMPVPDESSCSTFDWLLLDAHHPTLKGGTGETVDWEDAALIVEHFRDNRPVILAGSLTPGNVGDAIRIVRPFGIDVSSGVESSLGIKDAEKIRTFIQAAKSG